MPQTNFFFDKYSQGNFSPGSFFLSNEYLNDQVYFFLILYFLLINLDNFIKEFICAFEKF